MPFQKYLMASLCLQNKIPNPSLFLKTLHDLILISFAVLALWRSTLIIHFWQTDLPTAPKLGFHFSSCTSLPTTQEEPLSPDFDGIRHRPVSVLHCLAHPLEVPCFTPKHPPSSRLCMISAPLDSTNSHFNIRLIFQLETLKPETQGTKKITQCQIEGHCAVIQLKHKWM